jgi:hypothetical protein
MDDCSERVSKTIIVFELCFKNDFYLCNKSSRSSKLNRSILCYQTEVVARYLKADDKRGLRRRQPLIMDKVRKQK